MESKTDLVTAVRITGLTQKQAETAVDAVFDRIKASMRVYGELRIHNFGTFSVKTRAARKGRNPATGAAIDIAESKSVAFKSVPSLNAGL